MVNDRLAQFKRFGRSALEWPGRLLFPPTCPGCRRLVSRPGTLCGQCWPSLRFLDRPWCEVLGTPFAHDMGEGAVSPEAIANPPPFRRARSAVAYDGIARQLVHSLKFRDRTDLAPWIAAWMARAGSELLAEADAIVPVPLHARRLFWRRFNQAAELARALSERSGVPMLADAIRRVRPTRRQVGLGARAREDNVRGAFQVPQRSEIDVKGRALLVVDDVYTTGTTASAVARTLMRSGAASVDVLTFARVLDARS